MSDTIETSSDTTPECVPGEHSWYSSNGTSGVYCETCGIDFGQETKGTQS